MRPSAPPVAAAGERLTTPREDWIHHWKLAQFLYDWQTLIAGVIAVLAAAGTIWATIKSANREIAASQAQTAVAQKQIETTVRLERERDENEFDAFRVMLEAAMTRVLFEVAWAKTTYPDLLTQKAGSSADAFTVRQCITKGAFAELRGACVRQRSPLTGEFLYLEGEIDNFAAQWEDSQSTYGPLIRLGKHVGLGEQLAVIEDKALTLREKAAQDRHGIVWSGRAERIGI
jgi:hypothetical protein